MVDSSVPADIPDLTATAFSEILAADVASLPSELRAMYERFAVPAIRVAHEGALTIWIFGRSGTAVLGYHEVEDSYGTGTIGNALLTEGTVIASWSMYDELRWALRPFAGLTGREP